MLNILLNRYYIKNANQSLTRLEARDKAESILATGKIGETLASGAGTSSRGKEPHALRQGELQSIWVRHLIKEEEQKNGPKHFCMHN